MRAAPAGKTRRARAPRCSRRSLYKYRKPPHYSRHSLYKYRNPPHYSRHSLYKYRNPPHYSRRSRLKFFAEAFFQKGRKVFCRAFFQKSGGFSMSLTMTAFCACRRFSASSKISLACASKTDSVISSPRCAGRQCCTITSLAHTERSSSLT